VLIPAKALLVASLLGVNAAASDGGIEKADGVEHAHGVDRRGDDAMGFSHEKTTHHFALTKDGGIITASATDPVDGESRAAIVRHFKHVASAFEGGHFEMPMFIHDRVPPGVPVMKRLAGQIRYAVEETASGGRIVISTRNPQAVAAIHQFLRFQIEDHRTGDDTGIRSSD